MKKKFIFKPANISKTLNNKTDWISPNKRSNKLSTDFKNLSMKYAHKKLESMKFKSINLNNYNTCSIYWTENIKLNNNNKSKNINRISSSIKKNLKVQENNKNKLIKLFNKSKVNSFKKATLKKINNTNKTKKKNLFNFEKLKIKIGQNINYSIHRVFDKRFNKKYVIKEYKINNKKMALIDMKYSKLFQHENLFKYINNFEDKEKIYLLYKSDDEINFEDFLKKKDRYKFSEKFFINIFKQILNGLSYLHNSNWCHGDIKIENIFINANTKKIKIGNFENTIKIDDYNSSKFFGSFEYMSPEILSNKNYNSEKAELWSIGILFYRYLFSIFPYRGKDQRDLLFKINNLLNFPNVKKFSKKMENWIKICLNKNSDKRLSVNELLKLDIFN